MNGNEKELSDDGFMMKTQMQKERLREKSTDGGVNFTNRLSCKFMTIEQNKSNKRGGKYVGNEFSSKSS